MNYDRLRKVAQSCGHFEGVSEERNQEMRNILSHINDTLKGVLLSSHDQPPEEIVAYMLSSINNVSIFLESQVSAIDTYASFRQGSREAVRVIVNELNAIEADENKQKELIERIDAGENPEKRKGVGSRPERISSVRRAKTTIRERDGDKSG